MPGVSLWVTPFALCGAALGKDLDSAGGDLRRQHHHCPVSRPALSWPVSRCAGVVPGPVT